MNSHVFSRRGPGKGGPGKSRLAAAGAVACLTAAVAACSSAPGTARTSAAAALSPRQAVLLAARTAASISTFSGTMTVRGTFSSGGTSGALDLSGTMSGELHPSVLFDASIGTLTAGGSNVGPMDEILTSKALYLKMALLTQQLHASRPWVEMPLSALSAKSGISLSSLLGQAQDSSPLTQAQLLAGASGVTKVGTGTIDGTPVTEYAGTITLARAIGSLPAATRAAVEQATASTGIKSVSFKVWVDGQHEVRQEVVSESGTSVTETVTITLTSVNQPVTISAPPASQVTPISASALGGS